jgi:hypothetical protein
MKFKIGDKVINASGTMLEVLGYDFHRMVTSSRNITNGNPQERKFNNYLCDDDFWYDENALEFLVDKKPIEKKVTIEIVDEYDFSVLMKFYEKLFSQIFTEASTNNLNK